MTSASVFLILAGIVCLGLSGFMIYKLMPREGKPVSRWIRTEFAATSLAMGQFILLVAGVALLAKGIF